MRKKLEEERWDTKLGVWGRGVDPDLFSPARRSQDLRRQMLGVGPNDLAVLWLGRVVQEKQPGVWLKVRGGKGVGGGNFNGGISFSSVLREFGGTWSGRQKQETRL